jgi:acyl homoserine lactone synthase
VLSEGNLYYKREKLKEVFMNTLKNKEILSGACIKDRHISISDDPLIVKTLDTEAEIVQSYRLRHRIFAEELNWVAVSDNGLEIDSYDAYAIPFGVVDNKGSLIAHIRLITSGFPYMLERDFIMMVSPDHLIRKDTAIAETSRVCVAPEARPDLIGGNFGVHRISMVLYKGVYHWCRHNGIQTLYTVVENKIFRLLCAKGFPCRPIGEPVVMPDGTNALAVIMDWREFEKFNFAKRPEMMKWFSLYQSDRVEPQSQPHEDGSLHQISA